MINSTDLKNGVTYLSDGKPYKVVKYTFVKVGRGGATVRVTAKNLESGSVEEKTYSSNVKVEAVSTTKRKLQYLYRDGANAVFMDPSTYEQVEILAKVLKDELPYIKEGEEVVILFWTDKNKGGNIEKPLYAEIPPKVSLKVTDTTPGVKGNSAANVYKSAILENGLTVKVPLFIDNGELVRVDTRTGEYIERAKE
jgi:elongation factor P